MNMWQLSPCWLSHFVNFFRVWGVQFKSVCFKSLTTPPIMTFGLSKKTLSKFPRPRGFPPPTSLARPVERGSPDFSAFFRRADRMDALTSSRSMFRGRASRVLQSLAPNFQAFGGRKRSQPDGHEENGKRAQSIPEEPRGPRLSIATNQQIKDLDFLGAEIPPGSPLSPHPLRAHAQAPDRASTDLDINPRARCRRRTASRPRGSWRRWARAVVISRPVCAGGLLIKLLQPPSACATFNQEYSARWLSPPITLARPTMATPASGPCTFRCWQHFVLDIISEVERRAAQPGSLTRRHHQARVGDRA